MDYFYYSYTPFFKSIDDKAVDANVAFTMLTGYSRNEIIGKSIDEISHLLKVNYQLNLTELDKEFHGYIFTKKFEPREVVISVNSYKGQNEKDFFIEEKLRSKLEELSPYASSLLNDNACATAVINFNDGMIIKANKEYMDLLNISHADYEKCIGKIIFDIETGYKGAELNKIFHRVKNTGKSYYSNEFKLDYINKKPRYYFLSTVPIYFEGKPKFIISQAYNITESIENRQIVENQKEELKTIIENLSEAISVIDNKGNITLLNNSAKELLKVPNESSNIMNEADLTGDVSQSNILNLKNFMKKSLMGYENAEKALLTEKNFEGESSKYYSASKSNIYDKYGNLEKSIFCFHDVTDRIKNEENFFIKAQYELANKIIDNLELGLQRYTYPDYKIIDMNNKAYRELKDHFPFIEPLNMIRGKNIHDILNQEDVSQEIIEKTIKYSPYIEQLNYSIDGEEKHLKLIYQPLYGFNNQVTEIIVITMDVSDYVNEKKKMEEALKFQDELFVNVSHELKTPLNVIYSATQLIEVYLNIQDSRSYKDKINKSIFSIKQNCYRFTKLINNILDISKIETGHFKMMLKNENIVSVVENIVLSVSDYVKSKGLTIEFDTDEEEIIIACDPEKIERIILNLISNAIKFTNEGGKISVCVYDKEETVEITVEDTGIGISEEHINNIFKRYHQADKSLSRNAEGSGIGLSLIKSLVELHGGNIMVNSVPGKGSIFVFELPNKVLKDCDNASEINNLNLNSNKVELMNIEFSDIYDKGWN